MVYPQHYVSYMAGKGIKINFCD